MKKFILTEAQKRVMRLMSKKWPAETGHGATVFINGNKVCNIDTMTALVRHGLVERDTRWSWKATELGLGWNEN